ncbi:MAG: T9SS type A sorting domain-containing protein, partial [Flavobacteriales bacterium]|nr:T9SS type A sorting domain-containing protein [Flavobacteriales bacterium]
SYTDQSRYDAVAWEWTFEGGEPGTSTARNPIVKYPYPGTYSVVLKATGANGTSTTTSRNAYIRVNSNAGRHLPYLETFDNFTDGLSSAWVVEDEDKDHISWVTTNNGFDGNGYFLNNRDRYYGQLDALISPAIDLSNINNPILSFKYAYTRRTTNDNDMLRVYFSNDCGKTWQLRFTRSGAALQTAALTNGIFIPNGAAEWSTISINNFVSSDFTEGFLVKIELENRGGNSMYIDDFWIDGSFNFTPGLEFPRNGMTGVNEDIHLDWKAVPFVTKYEYQMSTSSVFSTMVASGEKTYLGESPINEDTRHFVAGLSANTTYYWRVRAYRGTDISPWSAVWSFTVSPTGEGYQYIDGSPVGMDAGLSSSQNIQLYPNPTNGRLTLHASSETSHLRITVYDIAGNALQVVSAEGSEITTDLSHLPSGVYILQVSADEHVSIHRIIRN